MNTITAKIYRIDSSNHSDVSPKFYIQSLIELHNQEDSNSTYYEQIECGHKSSDFALLLYINKASPITPAWCPILLEITGNNPFVKNIKSLYPSFILFFYNDNEAFVIAGGSGHRVIESGLDSQFGFSIVERLIDTSKDDVRGISQRGFLGVELAASRFFKADHVFNDEDNFGKYYRGLEVFIDQKKLKSIGVETNKKKLLVKGELGFKIDTKVTFEELTRRIKSISSLLKRKSSLELNPFKKLTKWQLNKVIKNGKTLEEMLDQLLANDFFNEFDQRKIREIYHPILLEYLKCSAIYAQLEGKSKEIPTYQPITPRLIIGSLEINPDNVKFPQFLELINSIEIFIVDEEKNKKIYPSKLSDWFFGEVVYDNVRYIKFEDEWFYYSSKFSTDLNNRIEQIMNRITIQKMNVWKNDISSEPAYNDSYSDRENYIVGDGIFIKGIEIADLISWTKSELIIYHIKNGLERDLRILQSQLINSSKIITELRSGKSPKELTKYYEDLKRKNTKNKNFFLSEREFSSIINGQTVRFVFAFATKSQSCQKEEIISEIQQSNSAIAKIAILHSFYTISDMGYEFSIAKIIRES